MGSTEISQQVVGTFTLPIIDKDTKNDDPWQRNYYQPPKLKELTPRPFPLIDIRPYISDPKYTPADLLKSHGFGIVKHNSALFQPPYDQESFHNEQALLEVYYPEIQDLVMRTTGAKHTFVTHSIVRGGRVSEVYKMPTGLSIAAAKNKISPSDEKESKPTNGSSEDEDRPVHVPMAAPVRVPHLDYTPLGARQTIRFQKRDIYDIAVKSGVIAAEDEICESHSFPAQSKEADPFIAEQYNQNGKLGPRYAAYSIWRPIKKVGRDPLALAPRRKTAGTNDGLVYWPYENKVPGNPELGGDFLRQYAMLGIQADPPVNDANGSSDSLQWYYLSAQEPDEVFVIKFFDSAALGEDAQDAGAPWHGSPDIGDVWGDHPRESIELRVIAFW